MKKLYSLMAVILLISIVFTGCSSDKTAIDNSVAGGKTTIDNGVTGDFFKSGTSDENYVELKKINDNIWLHITYSDYGGSRTPSNGVIAISDKGIVLIDTPWNNQQTKQLLKLVKETFQDEIKLAIVTHAHADRIGGIDTLLENNIEVRSTAETATEAEKAGYKKPQATLNSETAIEFGDLKLETYYPGPGHTFDNIVVWFPQYKVLYAACLIKSMSSTNLGNTEDADVQQWPVSAKKVLDRYSDAETVIPGHGDFGKIELVTHTIDLAKE